MWKKQFSGKKLIDLDMTLKMEIIVPGPESTNLLFQVQALIKTNETSKRSSNSKNFSEMEASGRFALKVIDFFSWSPTGKCEIFLWHTIFYPSANYIILYL